MGQSLAIPRVIPNDWKRLDLIVNKIKFHLGSASSPTFADVTITGLTASSLLQTDADKKLTSIALPLIVAKGGTGAITLTDHGILLGSGTGAVTPLGVASNGQLPIGSTGIDPVLATLTGSTDRISVTNGAGSITLDLGSNTQTLLDSFNGIFLETIDFTISESGGTVTGSLEQDSGGNLIQRFSDGYSILDCTPALTIDLTAYVGTDVIPVEVFVYILQSAKTVMAASNSDWPATEHIKVANLVLRSAATTGTDGGALVNRNWNDHAQSADSQGHITHIEQRIRQEPTQWDSGVALTLKDSAGNALTTSNSSTAVELVTSAGTSYQLHKHTFAAIDMYTTATDKAHIVNQPTDEGGAYETTVALVTDVTHYVDGTAAGVAIGVNKYFNLVMWGVQNRTGEISHLMINLPIGQYTNEAAAITDASGYSVFDLPAAFKGVGFLIARLTFRLIAGNEWTYIAQEDLRGQIPPSTAGVSVTTTAHDLLTSLDFASAGHTGFQAQGNVLDDLNATGANTFAGDPVNDFLVGTAAGTLVWQYGATARTSIGLGTGDSPTFTGLTLTNSGGAVQLLLQSLTATDATIRLRNGASSKWTFGNDASNDEFIISTGSILGTPKLTILQDGKAGFGTGANAPNAPLEVKGAKPGVVGGFQSGQLQVTGTGGEFYCAVITGHNSFNGNTQLWYLGSTSSTTHDEIAFINRQNAAIHFYTNNTSRMTIGAAGNVTLATIAAEGSDVDKFLVSSTGEIKYRTGVQLLSDIGGQAFGAALDDLSALTPPASDGQFIVATGVGAFQYESGATVRTSIGVGLLDSLTLSGLSIHNNNIVNSILHGGKREHFAGNNGLGQSNPAYVNYEPEATIAGVRTTAQTFTRDAGTWVVDALIGQYVYSYAIADPDAGIWLKITDNTATIITVSAVEGDLYAACDRVITSVWQPIQNEYAHGEANAAFFGAVFDGESIWLVPYGSDELVKVNPTDGSMTKYAHGEGAAAFVGAVYDGESIWLVPATTANLVKVNPTDGSMVSYAHGKGANAFYGGVFDGQNIWLVPYNSDDVVKVNPADGSMTSYALGDPNDAFIGAVFDGESIWLVPYVSSNLVKVDPSDGSMTTYAHGQAAATFWGGVFDGQNIWLIPFGSANLVKVNPADGSMTTYAHGKGGAPFMGGCYDGESIWLVPHNSDDLVKVNPADGSMVSYPHGKGDAAFAGGVFDGESVWLISYNYDYLVSFIPPRFGRPSLHTVGNLNVKGTTKTGRLNLLEKSTDPAEPAEGESVIWMSDGAGYGDDGDVCIAGQAGGTTNKAILFDHSAGDAW